MGLIKTVFEGTASAGLIANRTLVTKLLIPISLIFWFHIVRSLCECRKFPRKFPEISEENFQGNFRIENFRKFPEISGNFLEISKIFSKILNFLINFWKNFLTFWKFSKKPGFAELVGYKKVITFLNRRLLALKKQQFRTFPSKIENFRKFPPRRKFPEISHRGTFPEISGNFPGNFRPLENFRKF